MSKLTGLVHEYLEEVGNSESDKSVLSALMKDQESANEKREKAKILASSGIFFLASFAACILSMLPNNTKYHEIWMLRPTWTVLFLILISIGFSTFIFNASEKGYRIGTTNRGIMLWLIIASTISILCGGFILWIGDYLVPSSLGQIGFAFRKLPPDKQNPYGPVIQAAVGIVGAIFSAFLYFLNRAQKEEHLDRQLSEARHLDEIQRQQARAQSEYDSIADRYTALSANFSSGDLPAKVNAAIGLADIAQRPNPIRLLEEESGIASIKDRDFYPWFEPVAMQLAAALYLYEEPQARDQVRNAIKSLAVFNRKEESPSLLIFLIDQVTRANRTSYRLFIEALTVGIAANPANLGQLAKSVNIFDSEEKNLQCLQSITERAEFQSLLAVSKVRRESGSFADDRVGKLDDKFHEKLWVLSNQLVDTRDALAECLSALRAFARTETSKAEYIFIVECFLQGMNAWRVNIRCLHHMHFEKCQMEDADFRGVWLTDSLFMECSLQRARIPAPRLNFVTYAGCDTTGAVFCGEAVPEESPKGTMQQFPQPQEQGIERETLAREPSVVSDTGDEQQNSGL